jgi:hypothetical protein
MGRLTRRASRIPKSKNDSATCDAQNTADAELDPAALHWKLKNPEASIPESLRSGERTHARVD